MNAVSRPLLELIDLHVSFPAPHGRKAVLRGVSLTARRGEIAGLAGESGSGKSTIAFAILRYLGMGSIDQGRILFDGTDNASLDEAQLRHVRASGIALVPQDPQAALNPSMRITAQMLEVLPLRAIAPHEALQHARRMLTKVKLPDPERILNSYPHELSGGQQQRVLIAMALLAGAQLLLLDEPTTGLDASVQAQIVQLVASLVRENDLGCLFISHDLDLLGRCCNTLTVMRDGEIVEDGPCRDVLSAPRSGYTKTLLAARPSAMQPHQRARSGQAQEPILRIEQVSKTYHTRRRIFSRAGSRTIRAADHIDVSIHAGETLALAGESGSGKSTLARLLLGLERPDAGRIFFAGKDIAHQSITKRPVAVLHAIQMVFQNPASTLNPSHRIGFQLQRALDQREFPRTHNIEEGQLSSVTDLLRAVQLPAATATQTPDQLSGGQKQRVAIARALAVRPALLVADEPVSALDVSVQAGITELLLDLQRQFGLAMIFISHDLPLVRAIADRVAIMKDGSIVEAGPVADVFESPQNEYTRNLLAAGYALHRQA